MFEVSKIHCGYLKDIKLQSLLQKNVSKNTSRVLNLWINKISINLWRTGVTSGVLTSSMTSSGLDNPTRLSRLKSLKQNDVKHYGWFNLQTDFLALQKHSCMPSPAAPDPIRVQSCVCCLFWTNRNCMALTSIFLSISLSN